MALYNQTTSTTTEICLTSETGYCAEWEKTTETTYNFFDPIYLVLKLAIGFFIIIKIMNFRKK